MQSDGNSFCWDVVLESANMAYRDEDSTSNQVYEKQIVLELYKKDFEF